MSKHLSTILIAALTGAVSTLLLQAMIAQADPAEPAGPGELTVTRLTIVEENGHPAIVLGNSNSLPQSALNHENPGIRQGIPGIIFFNNLGQEIGGLVFPARSESQGGVQLSMDQIGQTGQSVALRSWRNDDFVRSMLQIVDYSTDKFAGDAHEDPEIAAILQRVAAAETETEKERIYRREYLPALGEKGYLANRIYLGSEGDEKRVAKLEISDSRSRPRIRIAVDENDRPVLDILDADGEVVRSLIGAE